MSSNSEVKNKYGDMYHEFTAQSCPRQTTIYRNGKEWMRISRRVAGGEDIPKQVSEIVKALNVSPTLAEDVANCDKALQEYKRDSVVQQDELTTLRRECRWLRQLIDTQAATLESLSRAMRDSKDN